MSADVRPGRRRVLRRRIGVGALVILLAVVGSGIALYLHLNGNLHTAPLTAGGKEKVDSGGHSPINILVMGSDTRASSADCAIGGDCSRKQATSTKATSAGANADVMMVVHISADRSNATVMSIPRDTMIPLPSCAGGSGTPTSATPNVGRINSTLQSGANCAAAAVHTLTGVPIDHFMVIDFAGVVSMSDAVGGVPVCVNRNVYDPYSHLKLTAGTHTLKGKAALEFLRTRHGFGDGGDIGRTVAQHIFLSSMLREMESASTLANPVRVLRLANAATSAVTVDTKLGSVPALTSLAYQLNQVPGARTTFVTMPTVSDPSNANAVIPAKSARALFTRMADDESLSSTGGKAHSKVAHSTPSPSSSSSSAPDYATTVTSSRGCAIVSTQGTVQVKGVAMTPTQAFAASPKVALSAK